MTSFMTHLLGPRINVSKFQKNMGILGKGLVFPFKGIWEYLNIFDFLGATQTESLTVFRDLFHDPSSGAQPKCTTAVWWGKILMKMTMALNCPIFTITATSMSSIMGRNPILKENSNFDTLLWFTYKMFYSTIKWNSPTEHHIWYWGPNLTKKIGFIRDIVLCWIGTLFH